MLKLYISGISAVSTSALGNLRVILDKEKTDYTLEVVDVIENPEILKQNNIVSTPLLERVEPKPTKRFTGDLIYDDNILSKLDSGKTTVSN